MLKRHATVGFPCPSGSAIVLLLSRENSVRLRPQRELRVSQIAYAKPGVIDLQAFWLENGEERERVWVRRALILDNTLMKRCLHFGKIGRRMGGIRDGGGSFL